MSLINHLCNSNGIIELLQYCVLVRKIGKVEMLGSDI